jgi:oligoribonuclease (3'-5' exoribonuclease)
VTDETETIELGWVVTDPDGNVVESGGVSIAKADGRLAEMIDQARSEGEQD